MATIIDGKALAVKKQTELVEKVEKLKAETGVVLVWSLFLLVMIQLVKFMSEIKNVLLRKQDF